jgi:hypothetical protein
VPDYIWTGDEGVQCDVEVEPVGARRPAKIFKATVRRILLDGLLPLAMRDGRPVEYVDTSEIDVVSRAKLFLDRRFGFGAMEPVKGATAGMRLFALERVPDTLMIAAYGRYGCPVCRIGEPDEEKLERWIEHAKREHGYEVITDQVEAAPGLPNHGRRFRVLRLRRVFVDNAPVSDSAAEAQGASENAD